VSVNSTRSRLSAVATTGAKARTNVNIPALQNGGIGDLRID
jgi:hypothetical protein